MIFEQFKVVAVSANKNSFGLQQCVMIAKDGTAYKGCANSLNIPKQNDILDVPVILNEAGKVIEYNFTAKGFEIPERIDNAPQEVIAEVWN